MGGGLQNGKIAGPKLVAPPSLKVRLRWFGAVLQYPCKVVFSLLSFNILIMMIY